MAKWLFVLTALLAGCSEPSLQTEAEVPADNFYVAPENRTDFEEASAEWSQYGLDFKVARTRPAQDHYSELVITANPCAQWPAREGVLGCAYAVRKNATGLFLDSAMTARLNGDAVAYLVELKPGVDVRREVLHELGHVAGFDHVPTSTVMNAYLNAAEHLVDADLANPAER